MVAPLKLIIEINAMGQALDKQDAYQLGLNDLEVAATWIGLLNGWNPQSENSEDQGAGVGLNPFYFRSQCSSINDSWERARSLSGPKER